jgi:transposase
MEKRKRRHFTPEYKAEVVRLVREGKQTGKSVGQIARDLDLTETSVRAWVDAAGKSERGEPGAPFTEREKEMARELKMLRMEREILKKAAAFFAKEST